MALISVGILTPEMPSSSGFIHFMFGTPLHVIRTPVENIFLTMFVNSFGPPFGLGSCKGTNVFYQWGSLVMPHTLGKTSNATPNVSVLSHHLPNGIQFSIFHDVKYDRVPLSHRTTTFFTLKISLGNKQTNTLSRYEL